MALLQQGSLTMNEVSMARVLSAFCDPSAVLLICNTQDGGLVATLEGRKSSVRRRTRPPTAARNLTTCEGLDSWHGCHSGKK